MQLYSKTTAGNGQHTNITLYLINGNKIIGLAMIIRLPLLILLLQL